MILNFYTVLKRVRALVGSANMRLQFEKLDQPRTDGKTIYVPYPSSEWSEKEMTRWEYSVYHEIGHCVAPNNECFDVLKTSGINPQSFMGRLWNVVEDVRQEHNQYGEYAGRDATMQKGRCAFLDSQLESGNYGSGPEEDDKQNAFEAALTWMSPMMEDDYPLLAGYAEKFEEQMHDAGKDYYHKLLDSGDRFDPKGKSAREMIPLIKEMMDYLGFDAEKEEEEAKKEEGETVDGGEKLMDDHGESMIREGEEGAPSDEAGEERPDGEETSARKRVWKAATGEYIPYLPSEVMKTTEFDGRLPEGFGHYGAEHVKSHLESSDVGKGLANTVRKLLQVYTATRWEHGQKKGKLGKGLHRVVTGRGDYQRKIFKKKAEKLDLDVAVTLLVDCSGSMNGEKYNQAAEAALLLNDAIATTLRIPLQVTGFTETREERGEDRFLLHHLIFKAFDAAVPRTKLIHRFAQASKCLEQNADGDSILLVHNELLTRKEKRKVLIVLSDGSPAAYRPGGVSDFTKKVVRDIEKSSPVEIYAIGIETESVRHFYKDYTILNNAEELDSCLLNLIKRKIIC